MSRGQSAAPVQSIDETIAQSYKNGELRELLLLASRMITQGAETVLGISNPRELVQAENDLHSHCKALLGRLSERIVGPAETAATKPIQLRPGSQTLAPQAPSEKQSRLIELQFAVEALLDIAWKQAFKDRPQLYLYVGPKRPSDAYGVVPLFQREYQARLDDPATPSQLLAIYEYCQAMYPPFRGSAATPVNQMLGRSEPMPAPPPPQFRQNQRAGSWPLTLTLLGAALLLSGLVEHYYLVPLKAKHASAALDALQPALEKRP